MKRQWRMLAVQQFVVDLFERHLRHVLGSMTPSLRPQISLATRMVLIPMEKLQPHVGFVLVLPVEVAEAADQKVTVVATEQEQIQALNLSQKRNRLSLGVRN